MKASEANRDGIVGAFPGARCFQVLRADVAAGLLLALTVSAGAAEFPQGLMLHFNFDEALSGGKISDHSGRGHDGRVVGATWTPAGKRGAGVAFAATNQSIVVTNSPALKLKQVTYAVWFQTSVSNAAARTLVDKAQDPRCVLGIAGAAPEAKNKGRLFALFGNQTCLSDTVVTDGNWHHAAATFDGVKLNLYLDGKLQKQAAARLGEMPTTGDDLVIGMNRTDTTGGKKGQSFNGTLDDAMIFNHVLTEAEIGAVIASVKPKFTPDQVASRVAELKELLDSGLILREFYDRKVKECEAGQ
jgi:hypothetical protein